MSTNAFLAALPALLAIAGFVIYQLIGHQRAAQDITKDIVGKLRTAAPTEAAKIEGLAPRQVASKLKWDHELRRLVSDQDFQLLTRVSQQEFVKALVVYGLIGLLFVTGVAAFVYVQTRPKPLAVSDWHLESTHPDAKGLAVDLDDLKLTWKAEGPAEDLTVALENLDTRRRTEARMVSSAQQYVIFPKDTYREVLAHRDRRSVNRVRAVARGSHDTFTSSEFSLHVGIRITAIPIADENSIWLTALIDNTAIPYYQYEAKLLVWPKKRSDGIISTDNETMKNPKMVFTFGNFDALDLNTVKVAYFGPDDARLVRTGLLE
jgi:hypothetical protein